MAIGELTERFERREDLTVTNIHGMPVYIDKEKRVCPTTTGIIDRLESEGKIRPPLYSTDGISRTTDRPGVVRWYARLVGEWVHERIAGKVDDDYEADIDGIRKQIAECEGVGADHDTVRNTIYNYRGGSNVRTRVVDQAEDDVDALVDTWVDWWGRQHQNVIAAELRLIGRGIVHGQRVFYGVRPDLLAEHRFPNDDEVVAVCLKATSRITDAHRMQAVATLHSTGYIDRAVIVRLDRERRWAETEEITEDDYLAEPYMSLYSGFLEEVLSTYRALN